MGDLRPRNGIKDPFMSQTLKVPGAQPRQVEGGERLLHGVCAPRRLGLREPHSD
jgi:hypothetical protein